MVFMCTVSVDTTTNFVATGLFSKGLLMNTFDNYSTYDLGLHMVRFQIILRKCQPEQIFMCLYLRETISMIANELLHRYAQESTLYTNNEESNVQYAIDNT